MRNQKIGKRPLFFLKKAIFLTLLIFAISALIALVFYFSRSIISATKLNDKTLNKFPVASQENIPKESVQANNQDANDSQECEIDGFKLKQNPIKLSFVVKKYGKPSKIKKFNHNYAEGCFKDQDYYFNKIGLIFNICEGEVMIITITAKSKFKTNKNIGIGSTRAEVIKAYDTYNCSDAFLGENYGADEVLCSDVCYTSMSFFLKKGKVLSISWWGYD